MSKQNDQTPEISITFNMEGDVYALFCRYANEFMMTPEDMLEIMVNPWLRKELQYFNPPPATQPAFTRKDLKP
ncbi:hypothetical protein GC177_00550 [bacterium]|nr:hypothetical protein [bacterium]